MMEKTTVRRICFVVLFVHLSASELGPEICRRSSRTVDCRNTSLVKITFIVSEDTQVLDLSFNRITTLDNEFFLDVNVNVLTSIYLNDNSITNLEPEVFKPLEALRHLYLQNNQIDSLHPSNFQTNKNLITLDLSGNKLMKINPNLFEKNDLLSWVNITRNPLSVSYIQPEIFSSSLNTLDIDICKIPIYSTDSSINSFQNIPYLKQLNLKESKVFTVQKFMSQQNMTLEEISSENNVISKFNKLGYAEQDELRYDRKQRAVFSPANASLICFCPRISAWFWCYEKTSPCENRTADVYSYLKCNATSEILFHTSPPLAPRSQSTLTTASSLPVTYTEAAVIYGDKRNVQDNETISGVSSGPANENSYVTCIAISVCIGVAAVCIVAGLFCFSKRRNRQTGEGRDQSSGAEWVNLTQTTQSHNPSSDGTESDHICSVPYDGRKS